MYFFRVDSNSKISSGHVMRCISIAATLVEQGERVSFLIADDNPIEILKRFGFSYVNLHSDWENLMSDVEQVKKLLKEEKNSTLIIDTYRITLQYVESLKPFCKIVYLGSKIDKLGNLDYLINYSADIDYSFYNNTYTKNTELLLGVQYAPLREEFQGYNPQYKEEIDSILLTTGNTDKNQSVKKILDGISPIIEKNDIVINVVLGGMFENKKELYKAYCNNPYICFYENVASMSSLMKQCDLAITANGTTVYELSALGIPSISFAMVEEQVKSAEALYKLGAIAYCGRMYQNSESCVNAIKDTLQSFIKNHNKLISLGNRAHSLIDGNGCQRIVKKIMKSNK